MNDTQPQIRIATFCISDWMMNCFVLHRADESGGARPCWVVDPGFNAEPVVEYIQENNLEPAAIILTHGHIDHIAGIELFRRQYPDIPIWCHPDDADCLTNPVRNLSAMMGGDIILPPATDHLVHNQTIELDGFEFLILHVPGHSPGSICLYQADHDIVIVGDALFAGSIGRTDFPGGSHEQLIDNIRKQLLTLPGQTKAFPGHGPETTIESEKVSNPFL